MDVRKRVSVARSNSFCRVNTEFGHKYVRPTNGIRRSQSFIKQPSLGLFLKIYLHVMKMINKCSYWKSITS